MEIRLEKFTSGGTFIYINPAQVTAVRVLNGRVEIEVSSGQTHRVDEGEEMVIGQLEG